MLITHIAHKHLNRAVYEKGGDGGASKAQAKAQQQAIDLQREQWNTVMNNLKPYAEVGLPALQQLQGLMTLEGQNKAANDFFGSGLYKTQADQARYQNLVSAEATGGLGSTATSNQLSSIAPMLQGRQPQGKTTPIIPGNSCRGLALFVQVRRSSHPVLRVVLVGRHQAL